MLRSAIVEWSALRYDESLRILLDAAPLFEKIKNHSLKGGYHNALAGVLEDSGNPDYTDRAFIEYAAASFHFEQARHKPYRANVQNNLGYLYFKVRRFKQAHRHLETARRLHINLKDHCSVAQVEETRARVYLAQGRNADAEKAAKAAVNLLQSGGQQSILTEALITHGRALARLGYYKQAYAALQRAIKEAQESGAHKRAGEAALTIIEELGEYLTQQTAQDALAGIGLKDVRLYEHELIKQALIKAQGRISHAARLLGTSHQQLAHLVENRHPDLIPLRTPKRSRKRKR